MPQKAAQNTTILATASETTRTADVPSVEAITPVGGCIAVVFLTVMSHMNMEAAILWTSVTEP